MRALWLPGVLRAAGLTVHEVPGWRTRGDDSFGPVRGITCHHTAGPRTSTDEGEIRTLLNGSATAPPPIAQLYLSRSGDWHVVASGLCYHNRVGWDGPNEGYGNDALLGIEAQHSGGSEPWTDRQYRSYVRGVAALVRHRADGWSVTVARVAGHKEHQPGAKSDPTFSMPTFRTLVAREITTLSTEDEDMDQPTFNQRMDNWWNARMDHTAAEPSKELQKLRVAPWHQRVGSTNSGKDAYSVLFGEMLGLLRVGAGDQVDEVEIARLVLGGLLPAQIAEALAAALPPDLARQTVDEIYARLAPRS